MQSKRKLTFNTVERKKSTKNASTYLNALFNDLGLPKGDGEGQGFLSLGLKEGRIKFQICTLRSPVSTQEYNQLSARASQPQSPRNNEESKMQPVSMVVQVQVEQGHRVSQASSMHAALVT